MLKLEKGGVGGHSFHGWAYVCVCVQIRRK